MSRLDTPILMADKSIKYVQDIKDGEYVMGDKWQPMIVMGINSGEDQLYKVFQDNDAMDYVVNSEHILSLYDEVTNQIVDIPILNLVKYHITTLNRYKGIRVDEEGNYMFSNIRIEKYEYGEYYGLHWW